MSAWPQKGCVSSLHPLYPALAVRKCSSIFWLLGEKEEQGVSARARSTAARYRLALSSSSSALRPVEGRGTAPAARTVDGYTQEIVFTNTLLSPQLSTCSRNCCSEITALECLQFILNSFFRKSPRVSFYLLTSFTLLPVQALFWARIKSVYFS